MKKRLLTLHRRVHFYELIFMLALMALPNTSSAQGRFAVSADGLEVVDSRTGLTWQRCLIGQRYEAGACVGFGNSLTYVEAMTVARAQSGWRLPTIKELDSLVVDEPTQSAIDLVAFPAGPGLGVVWSSTPRVRVTWAAMCLDFRTGDIGGCTRITFHNVRLVR